MRLFTRKDRKELAAGGAGAQASFWKDERAEDVADKMFGYAIGLFVLAYVAYEGIKAMVNTTGMTGTMNTIMTTVVPLIAAIGGIYLLYTSFRKKK